MHHVAGGGVPAADRLREHERLELVGRMGDARHAARDAAASLPQPSKLQEARVQQQELG